MRVIYLFYGEEHAKKGVQIADEDYFKKIFWQSSESAVLALIPSLSPSPGPVTHDSIRVLFTQSSESLPPG
jgi:hypothetical protein